MKVSIKACLLAVTAMMPAATFAQAAAAPADDGGIPDIIVTARKVTETLSDAPVSVSAISDKQIEQLGLRSIDDFAKQATGISFSQAFGRSSDRPVIRGQSNVLANVQFGVESGAAYFVDGIYYQGDIQGFDPSSIARVEIIKGPQSALYGRNTYSGAINYITKDPGDTLHGSVRASVAEYGTYEGNVSLSGPIAGETLGFVAGGRYYNYDGQYVNQLTGSKVGSERSYSGYLTLLFKPSPDFKIRLRGQYQHDRDGPLALFLQGAAANNCSPGFRSARYRQQNAAPPSPLVYQPAILGISTNNNQYFCGTIQPQPNNVRLNTDATNTFFGLRDGTAFDGIRNDQALFTGAIDWDIGGSGFVLTSLTGYRKQINLFGTDSDHSEGFFFLFPPVPAATTEPAFANTTRKQTTDFSQEIRITSPQNARIRGMVGGYYYRQGQRGTDLTFANPLAGEALGTDGSSYQSVEDVAIFGSLGFDISDTLTINGEIRYAEERKTILERAAATSIFCAGASELSTTFGFTGTCGATGKWTGTDPRITLDWKPRKGMLVYAVYATGRKPGGFNGTGGISATTLTGIDQTKYRPEKVKSGEVGLKIDTADRKARFSLAGFYNELTDVQLTRAIPPSTAGAALTSIVTNSGNAVTQGFEIEAQLAPIRELNISMGVAFVDAHFTKGCDADYFTLNTGGFRANFDTDNPPAAMLPFCSIAGKKLPLGSPWIVNGSMSYDREISGDIRFFTNTSFSYESSKFVQTDNLAKVGDTFLLNARVGVRGEHWSLTLYGRNLTGEDSVPLATRWFDYRYGNARRDVGTTGTFQGSTLGVETGAPRAFFGALRKGRTFGIEGSFNF